VRQVVLASANAGKLREMQALLAGSGFEVLPQSAFGIEAPAEDGATFPDNALIKARHAARASGLPAIADDSGLEVDALGGRPGIHSARFAGEGRGDTRTAAEMPAEEKNQVSHRGRALRALVQAITART
jgi:XTP/dITP diphosphohydrolase